MKKILWIEDSVDFIVPIKQFLEYEGWVVHIAHSVREGIKKSGEITPDLIIMDIIMDEIHGFAGIEDIKENPGFASTPIVIFSSLSERWGETTATREDAILTQAEEFIDKSEGPEKLINTVRKYLGDSAG